LLMPVGDNKYQVKHVRKWCLQCMNYICISHVWGIQGHTKLGSYGCPWDIPCSEEKIRKILEDCRNFFPGKSIWMDVLCVPQGDKGRNKKERLQTLPNIGAYYHNAQSVVAWTDNEKTDLSEYEKYGTCEMTYDGFISFGEEVSTQVDV